MTTAATRRAAPIRAALAEHTLAGTAAHPNDTTAANGERQGNVARIAPTTDELDELRDAYTQLYPDARVLRFPSRPDTSPTSSTTDPDEIRCDFCGCIMLDRTRFRHAECPAPKLPAAVVEQLARMADRKR